MKLKSLMTLLALSLSTSAFSADMNKYSDKDQKKSKIEKKDRTISREEHKDLVAEEGLTAAWAGDFALAEVKLREAFSMGDKREATLAALAWVRVERGDEQGAWNVGSLLIESGSEKNVLAALRLGEKIGKSSEAIELLKKRNKAEFSENVWAWLLSKYQARSEWKTTASVCTDIASSFDESWRIPLLCSNGYAQVGNFDLALDLLSFAEENGAPSHLIEKSKRVIEIQKWRSKTISNQVTPISQKQNIIVVAEKMVDSNRRVIGSD